MTGSGGIKFDQLTSAAPLSVNYATCPAVKNTLGSVDNVTPGNSYLSPLAHARLAALFPSKPAALADLACSSSRIGTLLLSVSSSPPAKKLEGR
jgi:hypothetical protein